MRSRDEMEALVKRAQRGTQKEIEAARSDLLIEVYPGVMRYLKKLCRDPDLAEDVCQDTMVRILRKIGSYRSSDSRGYKSFEAWVLTVATNAYRDYLRKHSRVLPVDEVLGPDTVSQSDTENEALDCIQREAVMDALALLPEGQRMAFVLKTFYGFSYREIGEITGCPEGTAKSRLHNAVKFMREELKRRRLI